MLTNSNLRYSTVGGNAHVKVKVVVSFKLFGVTIDEKFNFSKHVSNVSKIITSNCLV